MGIRFACPNGHELNIKEKYAGQRRLCPYCEGRVVIVVPQIDPTDAIYREFCDSVLGPGHSSSLSDEFIALGEGDAEIEDALCTDEHQKPKPTEAFRSKREKKRG